MQILLVIRIHFNVHIRNYKVKLKIKVTTRITISLQLSKRITFSLQLSKIKKEKNIERILRRLKGH